MAFPAHGQGAKWETFIPTVSGLLEISIQGFDKNSGGGLAAVNAFVYRFDHKPSNPGTIVELGEIKRDKNDEDGSILYDQVTLRMNDSYAATVREYGSSIAFVDGTDITFDTRAAGRSVMESIFYDDDKIWVVDIYLTTGATRKKIFSGDVDATGISWEHDAVLSPHESDEYRGAIIGLDVVAVAERLRRFTMQELLDSITWSDRDETTGDLTVVPFFAGVIPSLRAPTLFALPPMTIRNISNAIMAVDIGENTIHDYQVASPRMWETATYLGGQTVWDNREGGIWGIRLTTLLRKIAELCGFEYTHATDFDPPLVPHVRTWSTDHYVRTAKDFKDQCICLNAVFGYNPIDGSEWSTPITIARDGPVSDLVKFIASYGMTMSCEYNGSGNPVLRLASIERQPNAFPTSLTMTGTSTENPPTIGSQDYMRVETMGAEGAILCPASRSGKSIAWSIPWRAKSPAQLTSTLDIWGLDDVTHNANLDFDQQYRCFKTADDDDPSIVNSDCWLFMSYLYIYQQANTNNYYPAHVSAPSGSWAGYYVVSDIEHDASGEIWQSAAVPVAQLYAKELPGSRANLTRSYAGLGVDDMEELLPGATSTYNRRGAVINIEAKSVSVAVVSGIVNVEWRQIPDNSIIPIPYVEEGNRSSSSASGGGGSNGGGLHLSTTTILSSVGRGFVFADLSCETEPTGNSPPSGTATVDGVSVDAGDPAPYIIHIREGADAGFYQGEDAAGWIRLPALTTQTETLGSPVMVRDGLSNAGSVWRYSSAWSGSLGWATSDWMKIPIQAAIKWDGNITPSALTVPAAPAVVKVPLATPTVRAGGHNDVIGIDLSGSNADTIQVALTGVYRISASIKWTAPAGWGGGYVTLQILDETSTRIGLGVIAYQHVPAGAVTTLIHGSVLVDIDRYDTAGGTLPLGVQVGLGHTIAGNQIGTLELWQIDAVLDYRGEMAG